MKSLTYFLQPCLLVQWCQQLTFSPYTYDRRPAAADSARPVPTKLPPPLCRATTAGSPSFATATATAVLLLPASAASRPAVSCVRVKSC
jgi:hypothetical protein